MQAWWGRRAACGCARSGRRGGAGWSGSRGQQACTWGAWRQRRPAWQLAACATRRAAGGTVERSASPASTTTGRGAAGQGGLVCKPAVRRCATAAGRAGWAGGLGGGAERGRAIGLCWAVEPLCGRGGHGGRAGCGAVRAVRSGAVARAKRWRAAAAASAPTHPTMRARLKKHSRPRSNTAALDPSPLTGGSWCIGRRRWESSSPTATAC